MGCSIVKASSPYKVYQWRGTLESMPPVTRRVQVTLDSELAAAVAEFGGSEPSASLRRLRPLVSCAASGVSPLLTT